MKTNAFKLKTYVSFFLLMEDVRFYSIISHSHVLYIIFYEFLFRYSLAKIYPYIHVYMKHCTAKSRWIKQLNVFDVLNVFLIIHVQYLKTKNTCPLSACELRYRSKFFSNLLSLRFIKVPHNIIFYRNGYYYSMN